MQSGRAAKRNDLLPLATDQTVCHRLGFHDLSPQTRLEAGRSYQCLEGSATAMYAKEMAYGGIKDTRILNQIETIWAFRAVNQD